MSRHSERPTKTRQQSLNKQTPHSPPEYIQRLRQGFDLIDKNGDGFITALEYHDALLAFGHELTMDHIIDMIKTIDPRGEGSTMTFEQYAELMKLAESEEHPTAGEAELKETFRLFDKDGSGQISASELQDILSKLGGHITEQQAQDIVKKYDVNGNGHIDFHEFLEVYKLFA